MRLGFAIGPDRPIGRSRMSDPVEHPVIGLRAERADQALHQPLTILATVCSRARPA